MRQVGQLNSEAEARRFAAYLFTQNISATAEPDGPAWTVWIRDEDALPAARTEFDRFQAQPGDPRYAEAEQKARTHRSEEEKKRQIARKNTVQMRDRWGTTSGATRRSPAVIGAIVISGLVALLTGFGNNTASPVFRALAFSDGRHNLQQLRDDPQAVSRMIEDESLTPDNIVNQLTWRDIRRGQIWRLFTPMFLHFSVMHLVFNMYLLYIIGSQIENRYGSLRMVLLMLLFAGLSNVGQAWTSGFNFGGMSGVGYGVFGFAWMRSKYDPASRIFIDPGTVFIIMLWFVLCIAAEVPVLEQRLGGLFGGVANVAHAVGLAVGLAVGYPWNRLHRQSD